MPLSFSQRRELVGRWLDVQIRLADIVTGRSPDGDRAAMECELETLDEQLGVEANGASGRMDRGDVRSRPHSPSRERRRHRGSAYNGA